jgi:hypothetical protein
MTNEEGANGVVLQNNDVLTLLKITKGHVTWNVQNVIITHIVTIPSHVSSLNVNLTSMFNEMLKHSLISIITLTPNFASTPREKMLTKVKML